MELRDNDEVLADQLASDVDFAEQWIETELSRRIALALVDYRSKHDLTQAELAEDIGVGAWLIDELEVGDRTGTELLELLFHVLRAGKLSTGEDITLFDFLETLGISREEIQDES